MYISINLYSSVYNYYMILYKANNSIFVGQHGGSMSSAVSLDLLGCGFDSVLPVFSCSPFVCVSLLLQSKDLKFGSLVSLNCPYSVTV